MKKGYFTAGAFALSVLLLAGCGGQNAQKETESAALPEETAETSQTTETQDYPDEAYLSYLDVDDYVDIAREDYMGVEVTLEAPHVSDEQVENGIQNALQSNPDRTEITDRAAKEGDLTDISYVGKKDGTAFDGGSADNYELELGSGRFIEGFEDGIIGMKPGETKDLNLTFPETYSNAELAGADVVFTVTLNKIYELSTPKLDDSFVKKLDIENVETVDQYRQYLYDRYMEDAQQQYQTELENTVMDAVYDKAVFKAEAPEMKARYHDRIVNGNYSYLSSMAAMYGTDLETLLGSSWVEYVAANEEQIQASADNAAKQILLVQKIAENEGLTVTQEEIDADMEQQAGIYGYESADAFKEAMGGELRGYDESLVMQKVVDFLVENAKVTQTEPEPETQAETETETETVAR